LARAVERWYTVRDNLGKSIAIPLVAGRAATQRPLNHPIDVEPYHPRRRSDDPRRIARKARGARAFRVR
jgi:hypothetical protein